MNMKFILIVDVATYLHTEDKSDYAQQEKAAY